MINRALMVYGILLACGCHTSDDPPSYGASDLSAAQGPEDDGGVPADLALSPDLGFIERCFGEVGQGVPGPNYDQFHPTYPSTHCSGTNAQDITGVEQVVFLGDSVAAGTPPTQGAQFFRSQLATQLATRFSLPPPSLTWMETNPTTGKAAVMTSGAFRSCAHWGANLIDLTDGEKQIDTCLGAIETKKTLIVVVMGGNDLAGLTKQGIAGTMTAPLLAKVDGLAAQLDAALALLKDPARFPNGSYVVLANVYEFTDGTSDLLSCSTAALAGFNKNWPDGAPVLIHLNEQVIKTAVQRGVDVVFMMESFCGHGFHRDDPASPCYRGPNTPLWFDPLSCTHPNAVGHQALAELFNDVISE